MEYFNKVKAVKLRSHLGKYLAADEDHEKLLQSGNSFTREATWEVELIEGRSHHVRLKSYNGRYLTATDEPFLIGVTGNKVVQGEFDAGLDWKYEWEPICVDGWYVKLRSWCGKYLRGNGGMLPWRNSITHDHPYTSVTHDWILWTVEALELESPLLPQKMVSFNSSVEYSYSSFDSDDDISNSKSPLPLSSLPRLNSNFQNISSNNLRSGMDLFHRAKAVRLRSHHHKYLHAEEDEESVRQSRNGSSKNAKWTVELIPEKGNIIRLKSCYGKYLTASNQPLLLCLTGRKVVQSQPRKLDSSVEWEPVRDGDKVKLKTRYDNFLRANGGLPPWKNSVTYDIPQRTVTQDWILWNVDIVEIHIESPPHLETIEEQPSSSKVDQMPLAQEIGEQDLNLPSDPLIKIPLTDAKQLNLDTINQFIELDPFNALDSILENRVGQCSRTQKSSMKVVISRIKSSPLKSLLVVLNKYFFSLDELHNISSDDIVVLWLQFAFSECLKLKEKLSPKQLEAITNGFEIFNEYLALRWAIAQRHQQITSDEVSLTKLKSKGKVVKNEVHKLETEKVEAERKIAELDAQTAQLIEQCGLLAKALSKGDEKKASLKAEAANICRKSLSFLKLIEEHNMESTEALTTLDTLKASFLELKQKFHL